METMRAQLTLRKSCTRKTTPTLMCLMLTSMLDKPTFPRRRDKPGFKQHVLSVSRNWVCFVRLPNFHRTARPNIYRSTRFVRQFQFSPAGSSVCSRLSPILYSERLMEDPLAEYALFILDVGAAGQRDGAQQWYLQVTDYLTSEFELRICQSHQSLLKVSEKCDLQNVDDFLGMARISFVEGVLSPCLKKRFELSLEILELQAAKSAFGVAEAGGVASR